jgi:hypothetical protein
MYQKFRPIVWNGGTLSLIWKTSLVSEYRYLFGKKLRKYVVIVFWHHRIISECNEISFNTPTLDSSLPMDWCYGCWAIVWQQPLHCRWTAYIFFCCKSVAINDSFQKRWSISADLFKPMARSCRISNLGSNGISMAMLTLLLWLPPDPLSVLYIANSM